MLLHGLMAHGGFFREQQSLGDRFRLINVDLRGHGKSVRAGDSPNVERIALDISELVEALDLREAIGVGWSLGATVLWQVLAGPAADRFCGAVVVDMTARVRNGGGWELGLSTDACEARSIAIDGDFESFAIAAGQAIFAQPITAEQRKAADWASAEFTRNDRSAIASVWASLVEQDARPLLREITHPTLIIHGAHSGLYGEGTAHHLVGALPNTELVRFEASGHAPHLEQPELFNRTLQDFAERTTCGRDAQVNTSRGG